MAARKKSEEPSINIDEVLTDEELKAVANESEPAERKAKPEDGPRTVVVAEDEAVNRMDLVAMLEDNGYEVVGQAANGEEAVEQMCIRDSAQPGGPAARSRGMEQVQGQGPHGGRPAARLHRTPQLPLA